MFRASLIALLGWATIAVAQPVTDEGYELVRAPALPLQVGKRASLSLTVLPRAGHRLLADGPVLVRVRGEGVRPQRPLYQRADAVDPRAEAPRFELEVTPERRGPAKLSAHLTFYLCKAARCRPVETDAEWPLEVGP